MKGEDAMQIVDAQIHLWGTGLPSNLSHRQVTAFTPEEAIALMDEGGVDAAVIHPPGWDPGSTEMAFAAVPEVDNSPRQNAARQTCIPTIGTARRHHCVSFLEPERASASQHPINAI